MKSLAGSLLATLLGTAMLVIGIAGVAGAFDDDDDATVGGSGSAACQPIDPRVEDLDTFDLGEGMVIVNCDDAEWIASFIASDMPAEERRTVALWLYRGKKEHKLVAALPQEPGDDTIALSGELPPEISRYKKWVVSEEPADQDEPRRPSLILEQGKL